MIKTDVIHVRCTTIERQALELVAQHERRNTSETLREIVREAAQRRGLWPPDTEEVGDNEEG